MNYSKGNWTIGKTGGTVVTDKGDGFPERTGHSETDYYGGYLIAESIMKTSDAKLIAAAPDLLEALKRLVNRCKIYGAFADADDYNGRALQEAQSAIKKAIE